MKAIIDLVSFINSYVWGLPMIILLIGTGIWLTLGTRFVQVRQFCHAWRLTLHGAFRKDATEQVPGDITPFQALMTAISATVGNGNIAGVATAIAAGGPGAAVWMWLTGLVGMATKYAEAMLGVKYREKRTDGTMAGGSMYFLKNGLRIPWLGWLFALFGAIAAFGIGNMVQANSVALVFRTELGVPGWITGIVLAVLTWMVIIGGIKRIGSVAEVLVPVMCVVYFLGGVIIILLKITKIPTAFALIFKSAFTGHAAVGGFAGAVVRETIRKGVSRGIFSNEAGLGTASIAHAAAQTRDPVRQGNIAMLGVFIDTIIINTITTLSIVLTGAFFAEVIVDSKVQGLTSTALTAHAFSEVLGPLGGWIVAFGSVTFGYSTLLAWSYYGLKCTDYIFGVRVSLPYRWVWCFVIFIGAYLSRDLAGIKLIWGIADILNGAMAIPNLVGLVGMSMLLFRETLAYSESSASEG